MVNRYAARRDVSPVGRSGAEELRSSLTRRDARRCRRLYIGRMVRPSEKLDRLTPEGLDRHRSINAHDQIRIDGDTLTTQVWFPEDPRNARDIAYWKFKNTNVVDYENDAPVLTARFDFVV
ncbi:MAG: hypothetical protein OXC14_11295 [Rhodospirillaceae bacterium]|nr:hypothetical protein [Rhodospirillaceae bacterium]